jgi:hypothetical protein
VNVARTAIVLAFIGVLLCLWLLVKVTWYNFIAFMVVAQPLLILSVVIFVIAAVRGLRERGVL